MNYWRKIETIRQILLVFQKRCYYMNSSIQNKIKYNGPTQYFKDKLLEYTIARLLQVDVEE